MYYTIIPQEDIFTEEQEQEELVELNVAGVKMLINQTAIDTGEIVQIISSNPQDYLNQDYQPGTKIKFTPQATE
ncbi:MAG: YlzJ-like family protein [Bacillota bacterium]